MSERVRAVIAHPALMVAEGIAAILRQTGEVDAIAHDADGAVEALLRRRPDVFVCDELLPGGIVKPASCIVQECLPTNVVAVVETSLNGVRDFVRAFTTADKAVGVVSHNSSAVVIADAVHSVAEGRTYIDPQLAAELFAPTHELLSPREREVLALLETGALNKQIADQLNMSGETVKSHVSRILSKLGVANRTAAVSRAAQMGLLASRRKSPDRGRNTHTHTPTPV